MMPSSDLGNVSMSHLYTVSAIPFILLCVLVALLSIPHIALYCTLFSLPQPYDTVSFLRIAYAVFVLLVLPVWSGVAMITYTIYRYSPDRPVLWDVSRLSLWLRRCMIHLTSALIHKWICYSEIYLAVSLQSHTATYARQSATRNFLPSSEGKKREARPCCPRRAARQTRSCDVTSASPVTPESLPP